MRLIVLALAIIAGAKIWVQQSLFRAGAEEALVAAYQPRAVEACRKAPLPQAMAAGASNPTDWSRVPSVTMTVGNRSLPVRLWQTDHPGWNARFRDPHLVLAAGDAGSGALACTFDVLTGETIVARL